MSDAVYGEDAVLLDGRSSPVACLLVVDEPKLMALSDAVALSEQP